MPENPKEGLSGCGSYTKEVLGCKSRTTASAPFADFLKHGSALALAVRAQWTE
jgi:hypothetical protein